MDNAKKITDLFLPVALIFGLILVFVVPPFQSPDESNHFKRAYQISKGHFFPDKSHKRLGGELPASISVLCDTFLYLRKDVNARLRFSQIQNMAQMPLNADKTQFSDFPNTAVYAAVGYLPQALGIALMRLFDAPVLYLFYASRICNLLVWCVLIWLSLQMLNFGWPLFTALALLPASLAMASSANSDVLCNGLSWFLIASFITNLRFGQYGTLAYWALCLQKLIAWPLGLLLLVKMEWRRLLKSGATPVILIGLMLAMGWGKYAQSTFITYDEYEPKLRDMQTLNPGVNPQMQLDFILKEPIFFIKTILKSMCYALPSMAAHVVGKFGWEKNYLPAPIMGMLWLALLGLAFSEKWKTGVTHKLWALATVFAYWFAFSITMYALWYPVGASALDNWQARYFTPVLPLCFLLITQDYLSNWRKWVLWAALGVIIIGNVVLVWSVWMRYWR